MAASAPVPAPGTIINKAVSFASISNEVLARAAQFQHDKARSAKHACPVPQPKPARAEEKSGEADVLATDFLRTVEYCTGTAEHTRFHSRQSAVKNFAISNRYGKAKYWYVHFHFCFLPFALSFFCCV